MVGGGSNGFGWANAVLQCRKQSFLFRGIGILGLLNQKAHVVAGAQRHRDQSPGEPRLSLPDLVERGFHVMREGSSGLKAEHRT